jgi:DNA-binding winged helix-turn-helix (wHTH) protein/tetratricopeptide (TPR) repeat protein
MTTAVAPADKRHYRFDEFRVDPVRRRLLRGDEPVALTPKALSILLVLLEHRGHVVPKEEILRRVWASTHVTEANLTQNVSSLRKALGERASESRYVLTIPGQGYSFVAEVFEVPEVREVPEVSGAASADPAEPPPEGIASEPDPFDSFDPVPDGAPLEAAAAYDPEATVEVWDDLDFSDLPETAPAPPPERPIARLRRLRRLWTPPRRPLLAGLAALGVVLLAAAILLLPAVSRWRLPWTAAAKPAALSPRPSIAVLGFKNLSGREAVQWLAPALAEMLTTELGEGARVRVVSGENVGRVRQSLGIPYAANLDDDTLARIHGVLGADLLVVGSYLALGAEGGGRIRLDLRVLHLPDGDSVASIAETGTEDDLFNLVSRSGSRLRQTLGISQPSADQDRRARSLQPGSPQSARPYAEGLARLRAFDAPGALTRLQEAARLEPGSAAIHSALSQTWSVLGYDNRSVEEARKAFDLSRSLEREDRLSIEARLFEASKQWSKAVEIYRSLWTFYPDNADYGLHLAWCLSQSGHGTEAMATVAELRKLPPPAGEDPQIDLTEARVARRFADMKVMRRAADAAIAKGRKTGERLVVAQGLLLQGTVLYQSGLPAQAVPLFQEAERLFTAAGDRSGVALARSHVGLALYRQGDLPGAERLFRQALGMTLELGNLSGIAGSYGNLGLLYQSQGDLRRALESFEQARTRFVDMEDPLLEGRVLSAIATILCARGDLSPALGRAEEAIVLNRRVGSRQDEARTLQIFGAILAERGELLQARSYNERAFAILHGLGDPLFANQALAGSADVIARLGDLALARQRYESALASQRQAGDRVGAGQVLGSEARLAYRGGDLAGARKLLAEQLRIGGETGATWLRADALHELGRAALAAGDLPAARKSFAESLALSAAGGQDLLAASTRLELARLELADGRIEEAGRQARESAAWFAQREIPSGEVEALSVLIQVLLRQGHLDEARGAAARVRARVDKGEDRELRLQALPWTARADAAGGEVERATRDLRQALAQARDTGLVVAALELRLALGEVELRTGDAAQARTLLEEARRDAQARGFVLIARRAAASLGTAAPQRPLA